MNITHCLRLKKSRGFKLTPTEEKEYLSGLKELEEKETEIRAKYIKARKEFEEVRRELDRVYEEIETYKESFGIYQNVR